MHDTHGNVWEWCWDKYGPYPSEAALDPHGPATGFYRVARGGGWYGDDRPRDYRCAFRYHNEPPDDGDFDFGLRVVLGHPYPLE